MGALTNPNNPPETIAIQKWYRDALTAGHRFVVPAIADFELRRELERAAKVRGIRELDQFNSVLPDRYLPLTDSALKLAARLWGQARNAGSLPADPKELNGDVLIAAQVLDHCAREGIATSDAVIATVNVGHLNLFAPADAWSNIAP